MIEGQLDAVNGATNSPPFLKVENSPRGLHFPPVPHDDVEGWKRLNDVVPWFFKHKATLGAAIPPEGQEMANTAYPRSEEHTSELQSLMRISYAVFCLKKKKQ